MSFKRVFPNLVLISVLSLFTFGFAVLPESAQAEDQKLKGVAAWEGQGMLFQMEGKQAHFVGAFVGVLVVGNDKEPLEAAKMVCPATVETDLETGNETGHGRCILTDKDNNKIFAKWNCDGNPANCKGRFIFTGGTGKFKGISGDNEFFVNTDVMALKVTGEGDLVQQAAAGEAIWPHIQYQLP
ncbi:MAG: hypothetical protein OEU36_15520 [Gammaproteobacteria bacterium]|nr:hypothetical protein [Gammaproteobacteria bacterium]